MVIELLLSINIQIVLYEAVYCSRISSVSTNVPLEFTNDIKLTCACLFHDYAPRVRSTQFIKPKTGSGMHYCIIGVAGAGRTVACGKYRMVLLPED